MRDFAKEFKRKVKIRQFALENTGCSNDITQSDLFGTEGKSKNSASELGTLFTQLSENIEYADQSKLQTGYSLISSKRRLARVIVFFKKAVRKIINVFLGWYIKPILEKQTYYNGKALNSIDLLKQITVLQGRYYNEKMNELENKIYALEENLNKALNGSIEEIVRRIGSLDDIEVKMNYALDKLNVTCDIELLMKNKLDYFKFEDTFRGKRENIKEVQSAYVPYFNDNNRGIILDIGCGRGEFLELMWEQGISAYGVDIYDGFIDYCSERGLNVVKSDALTHLNTVQDCSLGGIFMSQVVEHLSEDYIIALISIAYTKLKPGSYFIMETPNPDCLAALSEFNIDMSHIKPVHYKALEFILKEANFTSVEKYHAKQTMYPLSAKHIHGDRIENADEFNKGIDNINGLLFGYRDYTLIAKK